MIPLQPDTVHLSLLYAYISRPPSAYGNVMFDIKCSRFFTEIEFLLQNLDNTDFDKYVNISTLLTGS